MPQSSSIALTVSVEYVVEFAVAKVQSLMLTMAAFSAYLDGRNHAIVITESLARLIAAIRITSVRWRSYLTPEHTLIFHSLVFR